MADTDPIGAALATTQCIAVVGMTDNLQKPGGYVAEYLIQAGFDVLAIHPTKTAVQGRPTYASLDAIPEGTRVDLIDVFRPAAEMPGIARQALRLRPHTFWMQLGLQNAEARALLEAEGITVIEDRCTMVEHRARLG